MSASQADDVIAAKGEKLLLEHMARVTEHLPNTQYEKRLADIRSSSTDLETKTSLYCDQFLYGQKPLADAALQRIAQDRPVEASILRGAMWKMNGTRLFREGKYSEARLSYVNAIRFSLGQDETYVLPHPTASIPPMRGQDPREYADTVACASNIAQCWLKDGNLFMALDWIEEAYCLHQAFGQAASPDPPSLPWKSAWVPWEDIFALRIKLCLRQAKIYANLGNSVMEFLSRCKANVIRSRYVPQLTALRDECYIDWNQLKRHPDPASVRTAGVTYPELQVRGVWKKVRYREGRGCVAPPRNSQSSFIHKGILYVFGGAYSSSKAGTNGWAIRLSDTKSGWRRLPTAPVSFRTQFYHRFVLCDNRAYLVMGQEALPIFDIRTESWTIVKTRMRDSKISLNDIWPHGILAGYSVEVYQDKLYVFGGRISIRDIGRNLFMVLDLTDYYWNIISGTTEIVPDYSHPGPRAHAMSWLHDGKLWITSGAANRSGALTEGKAHGGQNHSYADLWSYEFSKMSWTEEKMRGNVPGMRSLMTYTHNAHLKLAILFGGYATEIPYHNSEESNKLTMWSYYADTFVRSSDTGIWRQIITRGFPTYRHSANMGVDEETGRMYLYGGATSVHFLPTSQKDENRAKCFNDLWELCIDVPGGHFEESDWEVDPRSQKFGPYLVCFNCESVGRWMACSGTCRSTCMAASFCSTDCQLAAWPEHKKSCKKA